MVVSSLLATSCSFKFVSVLLGNVLVNVIQSRNYFVLLDKSVFHWLFLVTCTYCISVYDVPATTGCLFTNHNMENEI